MKILTKREVRVIKTLGQTLFPRGGKLASDSIDADVVTYIDRYMSHLSKWDQLRLRSLYQLFEFGIAASTLNPAKRFTTADPEERREYLEEWEHSSIYARRMIFGGMRSVFLLAYLSNETVSGEFGMDLRSEPSIEGHLQELARLSQRVKPGTSAQPMFSKKNV